MTCKVLLAISTHIASKTHLYAVLPAGFDKRLAVDKESYDKFDATVILETGFHENNTIFSTSENSTPPWL